MPPRTISDCDRDEPMTTGTFTFRYACGASSLWHSIKHFHTGAVICEMRTGNVYMRTSAGAIRLDDQSAKFSYDSALPGAFRKVRATITVEL